MSKGLKLACMWWLQTRKERSEEEELVEGRASCIVLMHLLCRRSHIMIDLSSETEIRYLPFGWNRTARTQLSCPV